MREETQWADDPGLAESLRESLQDLSAQAREETTLLATDARQQVRGILRRRKDRVAARLGGVAAALRDAGRRLELEGGEDLGEGLHDYAERAARQVERASDYVRGHEIGELVRDFEDLARERPVVFLGGSFLAGLLAARFLKSSGERSSGCGEVLPQAGIDLDGTLAEGAGSWPNAAGRP
jgi:hypothetical protein